MPRFLKDRKDPSFSNLRLQTSVVYEKFLGFFMVLLLSLVTHLIWFSTTTPFPNGLSISFFNMYIDLHTHHLHADTFQHQPGTDGHGVCNASRLIPVVVTASSTTSAAISPSCFMTHHGRSGKKTSKKQR